MPTTIIGFDEWKRDTWARFARRSTELKALDAAIERFHKREQLRSESVFLDDSFKEELRQVDLKAVDKAFGAWRTTKGLDYLQSTRNSHGAIEVLEQQLRDGRKLSKSEQEAFQALEGMRKQSIEQIFGGTQLEWRSLIKENRIDVLSAASGTFTAVQQGATAARIIRAGGQAAQNPAVANAVSKLTGDIVKKAFGVVSLDAIGGIVGQLVAKWVKDFIAAVTPWVGVASAGAKVIYHSALASISAYSEYVLVRAGKFIRSGDPSRAANALKELIQRNTNMQLRAAARAGVELSAKLASMFVDGGAAIGPATGAASAILGLIDTLCMVGREWQEKRKVNVLLENPGAKGPDLFATCPLLGAIYLSTASDYEIMMLLIDDFGRSNWMDQVEAVKKAHIEPVQALASGYVFNSRFALCDANGAPLRYRGTIPQTAIDKLKKNMGLIK